jgi:hypothetical protein
MSERELYPVACGGLLTAIFPYSASRIQSSTPIV